MRSAPESNAKGDQPGEGGWREALGERFADWPLLRLLIFTFWFRLAFLGLAMLGISAAVLLPKVWRMTSEGIQPVIRVSLLDRLQAWNLKRQARSLEARRVSADSFGRWGAAWANDPSDLEAVRGVLWSVGFVDRPEQHGPAMANAGNWLLRLGGTNATDVEIVSGAWLLCELPLRAVELLEPRRDQLGAHTRRIFAMASLQAGRAEDFAQWLNAAGPSPEGEDGDAAAGGLAAMRERLDAVMAVHRSAFLAGWGPGAGQIEAMERLRAAQSDPQTEHVAYNLELLVHRHRRDVAGCEDLLRRLEEAGRVSVRHRIGYWELLLDEGHRDQVQRQVADIEIWPANIIEAYELSRIYSRVEAFDRADRLLSRYARNVGWATETMVLHSEILAGAGRWEALLELALEIRMRPDATAALNGYSYYLAAVAETRMNREEFAQHSLAELEKVGIGDPKLAVKVASGLLDLGQPGLAEGILLAHRATLMNNPVALRLLLRCANYLKAEDHLLEAAQAFRRLRPNDPVAANNLAVALLVHRLRPEEAVRLTLEAVLAFPANARVVLNHADALLFNGRLPEAEEMFQRVIVPRLEPEELGQYRLVESELRWRQGRTADALAAGREIDARVLFPSQRKRLEKMLDRIRKELGERPS